MAKKTVNEEVFEDISSVSPVKKNAKVEEFAENGIKRIDKIIKFIAVAMSIAVLVLFLALAAVVFIMDKSFYLISVLVLAVGVALALVTLFLIYGLGHIITQNNELLKRK